MNNIEEDTEAAFKRLQAVIPQVKQAYEEAIGQIFSDLNSSDLESCASILEEHESTSLDTEQIVSSTRRLMTKIVLDVNQCFFSGNDVETKLTTLEMLKEQFAAHEGKNWNFNSLSPEELTRPLRMHNLNLSIAFMEQQLKIQEKELEIAMAKSIKNRQLIHDVHAERLKVGCMMKQQMAEYQAIKPQLMEMERLINDSYL
ncbi:uncharacterized protein LOC6730495 [Drosophila simulans]|uniref:GD23046 n=1 Tax=Drosophila simulans TaxID=7240 RepID=B4Q6J5_DROSI|nr:uncharacterized protein LOC6730495 [Drosophila simulans]EDX03261.1 GD23046 [Drosophila simulans]KMY87367.1 uncharacterized protein Dsimw501_GD23046 [Drosophila simulans]